MKKVNKRFYEGDYIRTPMGIEKVTWADERRFITKHYGNVPYTEGRNSYIFTLYQRPLLSRINILIKNLMDWVCSVFED